MLRYGSSKLSFWAGGGTAGIAQLGMAHLSMFLAAEYKTRPEHLQLLQDPKWGTLFDNGFHCDRGGTVPLAMLAVFLEARIAVELCEQRATSENKVIRLNK